MATNALLIMCVVFLTIELFVVEVNIRILHHKINIHVIMLILLLELLMVVVAVRD